MGSGYWIGIDGGGTKTEAVLIDAQGTELGRGTSGPSNYHQASREGTAAALAQATDQALGAAGLALAQVAGLGLGLAGAARPGDREVLLSILSQIFPLDRVVLTHDADAALVGGVGQRYGVVLIAGTGAIAYGANRRGETRRADGWGNLLGDEGSAYWIGREGLRAALRAYDGRGHATALGALLAAEWGVDSAGQLVTRAYRPEVGVSQVAALASLVSHAAEGGDAVAREILVEAGERLACTLAAVVRALDLSGEAFEVVLAGGVLRAQGPVRETVTAKLGETAPRARAIDPRHDAAYGAALLARPEKEER